MSPQQDPISLYAYHEAAHAVVGWLLGIRGRLNLTGNARDRGWYEVVTRPYPRPIDLRVTLAGILESTRNVPDAWATVECSDDLFHAAGIAQAVGTDPGEAFGNAAFVVAEVLSWPRVRQAIDALARALIDQHTLDEDAIDRIVAEAFVQNPKRAPRGKRR